MSRNKMDVGTMVRGMGMGMKLLQVLIAAVTAQGVGEEVFSFLTRPRFKANLVRIAKAIAECDWRIPASEMCARAEKYWPKQMQMSPRQIKAATYLWWCGPCLDLGIPFNRYSQDPSDGAPAIPPVILDAIHGATMRYPFILFPWGEDPGTSTLVVVDLNMKDGTLYFPGDVVDAKKILSCSVADTKYFDFHK